MGLLYIVESAAANWTVGQNIMDGENFEVDDWYRKVVRIGCTGSNAATTVVPNFILKYGDRRVASFSSTEFSAEMGISQLHMIPVNSRLVCRPGEPIVIEMQAVGAGNKLAILLDIKDIRPGRGR